MRFMRCSIQYFSSEKVAGVSIARLVAYGSPNESTMPCGSEKAAKNNKEKFL